MRLLLFSDLHEDLAAARRLAGLAAGMDLLVGAGDFGNMRAGWQPCIEALLGTGKPAVLVAGNNESTEELRLACRAWRLATVLHGEAASIAGVTFFGLGGGVPVTPFGSWSYDLDEDEAASLLAPMPEGCVLVSHSPPKGALDMSSSGASLGSTAVRDAVLRLRPRLVVCGHVHGSAGRHAELEGVPVVNAGPAGMPWTLAGHAA